MTFTDLRLAEPILRAIAAEGYSTPTPIQAKAIPHVLAGSDLLGCAQTGTGKTAAFALPLLHLLLEGRVKSPEGAHGHPLAMVAAEATHAGGHNVGHNGGHRPAHQERGRHPSHHQPSAGPTRKPRVLILSPTRELAVQIGDSFRVYGKHTGTRFAVIYGGVGQNPQVDAIRRGVDVIIATPGRLLDLMQQRHLALGSIDVLVLDEADRMLDMGFIDPIREIVAKIPTKRQTLMFSATMPREIRRLAENLLRNPVSVEVAPVSSAAETVAQSVHFVTKKDKPALLLKVLRSTEEVARTLVFTRTKHGADKVVKGLYENGIRAEAIHGNKRQNVRQKALDGFKSGRIPVLVATDIAARGIDVDNIALVINFDIPHEAETYVHRIGRTGRAGASGHATSFCDYEERGWLRDIERLMKRPIPVNAGERGGQSAQPAQRETLAAHRGAGAVHEPKPVEAHAKPHAQPHAPPKAKPHAPARDHQGSSSQLAPSQHAPAQHRTEAATPKPHAKLHEEHPTKPHDKPHAKQHDKPHHKAEGKPHGSGHAPASPRPHAERTGSGAHPAGQPREHRERSPGSHPGSHPASHGGPKHKPAASGGRRPHEARSGTHAPQSGQRSNGQAGQGGQGRPANAGGPTKWSNEPARSGASNKGKRWKGPGRGLGRFNSR